MLTLLCPVANISLAQDWPQILGPNRNGQSATEFKPRDWSQLEPKWTITLGSGYAGPAIVGSKVIVAHRQDGQEIIAAFDTDSGNRIWQTGWNATYRPRVNPDDGPRCVPTVADGRVVCYGAAGDLTCVRLEDGKELWRRSLREEYRADDGYFGAGSSPLIVDGKVIVCLGGREAGIVALNLSDGKTQWTATDYDASYASPISFQVGPNWRVLVVTRYNTVLLNPADGTILGDVPFGARGPTVNAATPIALPSTDEDELRFLLTSSYQIGALVLAVKNDQLSEVRRDQDLLSSQYNTPVLVGDRILGIDGREDLGVAGLRCIDAKKLQPIWDQADFGTAHLFAVGSQTLSLNIEGQLKLVDSNQSKYEAIRTANLPEGTYRAIPALSGNRIFVRSTLGNLSTLARYDL